MAGAQIRSGTALAKLEQIIQAQGGDRDALFEPASAPSQVPLDLAEAGIITGIDAQAMGLIAMHLGAGRATKEDVIDPKMGIVLERVVGDAVTSGQSVATLFAAREEDARQVTPHVAHAFTVAPQPLPTAPLIYETLGLPDA